MSLDQGITACNIDITFTLWYYIYAMILHLHYGITFL